MPRITQMISGLDLGLLPPFQPPWHIVSRVRPWAERCVRVLCSAFKCRHLYGTELGPMGTMGSSMVAF